MEILNFLNESPLVVSSFVRETSYLVHKEWSNFYKISLYQHYFPDMVPRTKFTGFENVSVEDHELRQELIKNADWLTEPNLIGRTNTQSFSEVLAEKIQSLGDQNLIFFSGGMDSEFLVRWFMKFNHPFLPIVIDWSYGNRGIVNSHDTVYARNFCKNHGIKFIALKQDLEEIWKSPEIRKVSQDMRDVSPQRCAYKIVSDRCSRKYPGFNRIFAGEIRYKL